VEFSEHRRYAPGDDPKDIDWLVFAKTDKYYVKKFEAETNITGYLVMDLSQSMGFTHRQELTKFDYSICLAASLAYLMVHQQDPVGLITFDEEIRDVLPPKSKRTQLGTILGLLARLKPTGPTEIAKSLTQVASMFRHKSLVMLFSDLLAEPGPVFQALRRLRHRVRGPGDGRKSHRRCFGLSPRLQVRARRLPRTLQKRVLPDGRRLRPAGYEHAVRQGAARVPGEPAESRVGDAIQPLSPDLGDRLLGDG
jgi:uncharacterized protein (DUF58 family)